jgi:hypothetical protein
MRLKNSIKKSCAYFLLILFLGYYGSITMFFHSHIISGDTVVHSHPFRTDNNGLPLHSHTTNGFITIHLLSTILVSLSFLVFGFKAFAQVINGIICKTRAAFFKTNLIFLYSLRAPPLNMFT